MSSTISITCKDLTVGYADKKRTITVLSDINFEINSNSFNAILGQNGIGKSTLLKTLTKIITPISGEIHIEGKDLQRYDIKDLSKLVSTVLTEKLPENNLTVYEIIALGRYPYTNWIGKLSQNDQHIIEKAIEFTHLKDYSNVLFHELSDGLKQRTLIARALSQDTPIIILDEPTSHLDILNKIETFNLLQKLSKELEKTVLISTHELQLALDYTDNLLLVNSKGIATNTPEIVIQNNLLDSLFEDQNFGYNSNERKFYFK